MSPGVPLDSRSIVESLNENVSHDQNPLFAPNQDLEEDQREGETLLNRSIDSE
jgi:hypothetical protein